MNARLISFTLAAALLGSTAAYAGQPNGRDSVYAAAGPTTTSPVKGPAVTRAGRASVYAADVPAPTPKDQVRIAVTPRPGRA